MAGSVGDNSDATASPSPCPGLIHQVGCDLPLLTSPKVPQDTLVISASCGHHWSPNLSRVPPRRRPQGHRNKHMPSLSMSISLPELQAWAGVLHSDLHLPQDGGQHLDTVLPPPLTLLPAARDPTRLSEETATTWETAEGQAPQHQAAQVSETPPVTDAQCHTDSSAAPSLGSQKLVKSFPEETSPLGPTQL